VTSPNDTASRPRKYKLVTTLIEGEYLNWSLAAEPSNRGSIPGKRDFPLLQNVQTGSRVHPASHSMPIESVVPTVRRPRRKDDYAPTCGIELENECGTVPLLLTYAFSPCTETSITSLHQVGTDFSAQTFNYSGPGTHCLRLKRPEPADNHFPPSSGHV